MEQEFSQRSDGKFNHWRKQHVKGYVSRVWVIVEVYDALPKWSSQYSVKYYR